MIIENFYKEFERKKMKESGGKMSPLDSRYVPINKRDSATDVT